MKNIPIHERFYSFQGEGVHMGRSAFFIRTFGCPVKCPWCDSAGTWHPNYVPAHIEKPAIAELLVEIEEARPQFVVITGGEPTVHDLTELTQAIASLGYPVHLETCGAYPIKGYFDWITLSPKHDKKPLAENIRRADEIKIIVERIDDVPYWIGYVKSVCPGDDHVIWLHPEWSKRHDPQVLREIVSTVKSAHNAMDIRAGYQLHKLYAADALDNRAKPTVPLGGDPKRGF
jgi:7-carboxy-7-deazaguanine synthase